MRAVLIAGLVLVTLVSPIASAAPDPDLAKKCRDTLRKAKKQGIFYKTEPTKQGREQAFVDLIQWLNLPFDEKVVFAQVIACQLTDGDREKKISFDVLDHRNLTPLAYWDGTELKRRF